MKSSNAGESTTAAVDVVQISKHALWLNVDGEEFFMPFERYPWFERATLGEVFNVELLHGFHLRWLDLDVDLELDALRHPEKYPLRFDPSAPLKYVVVVEKADSGYGASVPDLPGCVAVGDTIEDVEKLIREAIEVHIEGLRQEGLPVPEPSAMAREINIYGMRP